MKFHACHANHCAVVVDPAKGMCLKHWRMVPAAIQGRIYAAARKHKTSAERLSSAEFLEAWADAVESVAMQEGRLTRNTFRNLANWVKRKALSTAGTQVELNTEERFDRLGMKLPQTREEFRSMVEAMDVSNLPANRAAPRVADEERRDVDR